MSLAGLNSLNLATICARNAISTGPSLHEPSVTDSSFANSQPYAAPNKSCVRSVNYILSGLEWMDTLDDERMFISCGQCTLRINEHC